MPGSKLVKLIDLGIEILWEILCRMRLQYNTVLGLKPENRVEEERKEMWATCQIYIFPWLPAKAPAAYDCEHVKRVCNCSDS